MAYETPLLPPYPSQHDFYYDEREAFQDQENGRLVRPYIGEDVFHEDELDLEPPYAEFDPLTAPFTEVIQREYGPFGTYESVPTIWDRQSDQAYQEQLAHGTAMARSIALRGMKRVSEYRANFPKDTDTLQLRIVEPQLSSVDIALAELRQLREEIAYEKAHPPMFSKAQDLHAKYIAEQSAESELAGGSNGDETHIIYGSVDKPERRLLGPIGRESSKMWRIAKLSKNGAKLLLERLKRQTDF